jgi:glucose/mannose transport system permease protein
MISTLLGALNGYVLTKWRFPGHNLVFGMMLLACFIPFQIVPIPMARILGLIGLAGTIRGLILVHVVYGLGFTTLFFRNYYEAFLTELIKAARSTVPASSGSGTGSSCRARGRSSWSP